MAYGVVSQFSNGVVVLTQVLSGSRTYHVGVCSGAMDVPQGKCKDAAVCLVSGNNVASFGNVKQMKIDYQHQYETLMVQYKGGDGCPPGKAP